MARHYYMYISATSLMSIRFYINPHWRFWLGSASLARRLASHHFPPRPAGGWLITLVGHHGQLIDVHAGTRANRGDDGAGAPAAGVIITGCRGAEGFRAVPWVLQEAVSEGGEGCPANRHQGLQERAWHPRRHHPSLLSRLLRPRKPLTVVHYV